MTSSQGALEYALAIAVCSQLMVMATALVWLIDPDVPVTITLVWAWVWDTWGLLLELLPHPRENSETTTSKPSRPVQRLLLVRNFLLREVRTVPNSPRPGSTASMPRVL